MRADTLERRIKTLEATLRSVDRFRDEIERELTHLGSEPNPVQRIWTEVGSTLALLGHEDVWTCNPKPEIEGATEIKSP